MTTTEWWLVVGMMVVTFGPRLLALSWSARHPLPLTVQRLLVYLPVAVLMAVAAPVVVAPQGEVWLTVNNPGLWAAGLALLLGYIGMPAWLTIVVSCVFYGGLRWWLS